MTQTTVRQPSLLTPADRLPIFGGRQLTSGFDVPATADAMPLFQPWAEAKQAAEEAMPVDQLLRARGDTELFREGVRAG